MSATLYGVSVGPGDPELITLKAKKIIESCDVIAAPKTKSGEHLALDIASSIVDVNSKTVVFIESLMTRDPDELRRSHEKQASILEKHLLEGRDVALLNIGDVSVFSTFSYIAQNLKHKFSVEVVPGVTSFCAAAAVAGESLTTMNEPLHIIPASGTSVKDALELNGTKVLMKSGKQLRDVLDEIKRQNLSSSSWMVQNCGLKNQNIIFDIDNTEPKDSYFTLVVVKEKDND